MTTSRKPGENPGEKKIRRWKYEGVKSGTSHRGWIAREHFGAYVHFDLHRSHPCAALMSNHELRCEFCARKFVPMWRGYVPWYDDHYLERFSMVTEDYIESVEEIPHLAHIVLTRGAVKTDPCVITAKPWITTPIPFAAKRTEPVNLSDFLVHVIWDNMELREWDRAQKKPVVVTVEQAKEAAFATAKSRLEKFLVKEQKAQAKIDTAGELAERVIHDALHPKPNGKPFKPPA